MALSFTDDNGQPGNPGRAKYMTGAIFECPALAATYDGHLVAGNHCDELDETYALKTIAMHSCGLLSKTSLRELPGGAEVLDAFENRRLFTSEMELAELLQLLVFLRDQVRQQVKVMANGGGTVRIRNVFVSVPNYMQNGEKKEDLDKLEADYLGILCPIWAAAQVESIRVFTEGQAVVSYLCAAPDDPLGAWRRKEMWQCFRDLRDDEYVRHFVVIDSGSSSVNIEVLRAYFDETGELIRSESHCEPGWQQGVRGGIGITNNAIRPWIREQVEDLVPEGELAHLTKQWEEVKGEIDYTEPDASVTLRGKWSNTSLVVTPRKIHQVYKKAFKPVSAAVRSVVERMLQADKDFGIIFSGGSFCNPGYRKTMQGYISGVQAKASQDERVRVRSAAVAKGLTSIAADTPSLAEVFQDSCIGLQLGQARSNTWIGRPEANILFSKVSNKVLSFLSFLSPLVLTRNKKHGRIVDFTTHILPRESTTHRFELVCHPAYGGGANDATFEMGPESGVHLGPPGAYRMAFQVPCEDLPRYVPIRWRLQGSHLDSIRHGDGDDPPMAGRQRLGMFLSCSAINSRGRCMPNIYHKMWHLGVSIHPATKQLRVDFSFRFPAKCAACKRLVLSKGWQCMICRDVQLCERCYGGRDAGCARLGHVLVMFEQDWFLTV
ncbi:hypothetical protein PG991_008109 [Apiospora marii]|uniref:ZZ-type domain-containing protein n=1 Tax=Apiospora marii TaxID=335849 RepID=A0ABR1RWM7_9PEZI